MKAIFPHAYPGSADAPDAIIVMREQRDDQQEDDGNPVALKTTLSAIIDRHIDHSINDDGIIWGPHVAPMTAIRDALMDAAQRITHALPKAAKVSHPSGALMEAMRLVRAGDTPYAAAKKAGIALSTMYRSKLYKQWKDEAALEKQA